MNSTLRTTLISGLKQGSIVPYLGPGVLADVVDTSTGTPIPATSDQLILAMNGGKPMSPRLMYEFPRAAMNIELKRGRSAVNRFLTHTYGETGWTRSAMHDWLKAIKPPYIIDINRDTQLPDSYADTPHTLLLGCARMGGSNYRFNRFSFDGENYCATPADEPDPGLPILFKPMGCPKPQPSYIASDADYVDYITELMGGFAIPPFVKTLRRNRQYLLLGMSLDRDTERMVLSDMIHDADSPAGWALIANPTAKARRFLDRHNIEILPDDWRSLLVEA